MKLVQYWQMIVPWPATDQVLVAVDHGVCLPELLPMSTQVDQREVWGWQMVVSFHLTSPLAHHLHHLKNQQVVASPDQIQGHETQHHLQVLERLLLGQLSLVGKNVPELDLVVALKLPLL